MYWKLILMKYRIQKICDRYKKTNVGQEKMLFPGIRQLEKFSYDGFRFDMDDLVISCRRGDFSTSGYIHMGKFHIFTGETDGYSKFRVELKLDGHKLNIYEYYTVLDIPYYRKRIRGMWDEDFERLVDRVCTTMDDILKYSNKSSSDRVIKNKFENLYIENQIKEIESAIKGLDGNVPPELIQSFENAKQNFQTPMYDEDFIKRLQSERSKDIQLFAQRVKENDDEVKQLPTNHEDTENHR